jgi:hypothetical protein
VITSKIVKTIFVLDLCFETPTRTQERKTAKSAKNVESARDPKAIKNPNPAKIPRVVFDILSSAVRNPEKAAKRTRSPM